MTVYAHLPIALFAAICDLPRLDVIVIYCLAWDKMCEIWCLIQGISTCTLCQPVLSNVSIRQ